MYINIVSHIKPYKGNNPEKQARFLSDIEIAKQLEAYFESQSLSENGRTFTYHDIANDTRLYEKDIRRLLMPICGGHNGITLNRG